MSSNEYDVLFAKLINQNLNLRLFCQTNEIKYSKFRQFIHNDTDYHMLYCEWIKKKENENYLYLNKILDNFQFGGINFKDYLSTFDISLYNFNKMINQQPSLYLKYEKIKNYQKKVIPVENKTSLLKELKKNARIYKKEMILLQDELKSMKVVLQALLNKKKLD